MCVSEWIHVHQSGCVCIRVDACASEWMRVHQSVYMMCVQVPLVIRRRCWSWSYRHLLPARCGCWEPNLFLVQEQPVFITSEPSLHPLIFFFLFWSDRDWTQGTICQACTLSHIQSPGRKQILMETIALPQSRWVSRSGLLFANRTLSSFSF